jgi:hypothetical protein
MNSRHVKIGVAVVTAGVAILMSVFEIKRQERIKSLDSSKQ